MAENQTPHAKINCKIYQRSKAFYVDMLGLEIVEENYHEEQQPWNLKLRLPYGGEIELQSSHKPSASITSVGVSRRHHLVVEVANIERSISRLLKNSIKVGDAQIDEYTCAKFVFFRDPDGFPIEMFQYLRTG